MDNDITLIKLQRPSEYAPIDLDQPGDNTWHEVGTNLVTAGWGTLSAGGGTPDKAQHVTVPVVPDCADTNYGPSVGIEYNPETMVCAGTVGLDACQGDSGGPLFGVAPTGARTLVGNSELWHWLCRRRLPGRLRARPVIHGLDLLKHQRRRVPPTGAALASHSLYEFLGTQGCH